jgi:hypothetical protein
MLRTKFERGLQNDGRWGLMTTRGVTKEGERQETSVTRKQGRRPYIRHVFIIISPDVRRDLSGGARWVGLILTVAG